MAYSRWTDSRFYTYWCDSDSNKRDDQIFLIQEFGGSLSFTYKELKEDMDICIEKCIEFYNYKRTGTIVDQETTFPADPLFKVDVEELKEYMNKFILDVEKEDV